MAGASRLTSASDIRRTYSEGRKASSPAVVAHVRLSGEARPPRIGVSATRGTGTAVQRNRAKRRVREAVRSLPRPLTRGADVMLVVKPDARSVEFQKLVDSVGGAIDRAGGLDA